MATKYEYYDTGDDGTSLVSATKWNAQTFTPLASHTIASVKLCFEVANYARSITVSIRATNGDGKPTGADLCSGNADIPVSNPNWITILLGAGYNLFAGIKYAILLRQNGGGNWPGWRYATVGDYPRGAFYYSNDSGVTWIGPYSTWDQLFEEWDALSITGGIAQII